MSKLTERNKQYGIPTCPYLPAGKVVLIYRLPSESKSAGGIIIPDEHATPKPSGVLVAAGLAARDILADALVEIGDIVWFGKYAGWEKEVERDPLNAGKMILQCNVDDVLGSVDALERLESYDIKPDSTGKHFYTLKTNKRKAA